MITPAILVLLLQPYGFAVTERCLTDWRQKGELPQLLRRSRGYRAGVLRYWAEKDILEIALAVCRRLKGPGRKRSFGVIRRNWLAGAEIPTLRAKKSWLGEMDRSRHTPRYIVRKCASELSRHLDLKTAHVLDLLDELLCIWQRPNHRPGAELDITLVDRFIRRAGAKLGAAKNWLPLSEKDLTQALTFINALLSPAGFRNLIASASPHELREARDRYLNWWRKLDASWQGLLGKADNSSLMPLANSLAPLIVPLLLPSKPQYRGAEGLQLA